MTLVRKRPVIVSCLLALSVLGAEMGFFNLAAWLGPSDAASMQGGVLLIVALVFALYVYAIRICWVERGGKGVAPGLVLILPAMLLGFFIAPEFACNAGHGCM